MLICLNINALFDIGEMSGYQFSYISRYLGHDGDPLSVDSTEHSVLEEDGEVSLCRLLESEDGGSLKPREKGT